MTEGLYAEQMRWPTAPSHPPVGGAHRAPAPAERLAPCASPPWPAASAAPGSCGACAPTSTARPTSTTRRHRHRQHRRRHHALRPAGLPRPRHRPLHPRRRHQRGPGLGTRGRDAPVQHELAAYGAVPQWFGLGDRDFGTHVVRSPVARPGLPLSEVTARLADRWGRPAARHAAADDRHPGRDPRGRRRGRRAARGPLPGVVGPAAGRGAGASGSSWPGMDRATPAPGVLDAIRDADVVLLPPSNPVVSIGIILGVPGVRDALRGTRAPVVGVSPLIGGAPVRGHADACLRRDRGRTRRAGAVAGLYEPTSSTAGSSTEDDGAGRRRRGRLAVAARPLLMHDVRGGRGHRRRRARPRRSACATSRDAGCPSASGHAHSRSRACPRCARATTSPTWS